MTSASDLDPLRHALGHGGQGRALGPRHPSDGVRNRRPSGSAESLSVATATTAGTLAVAGWRSVCEPSQSHGRAGVCRVAGIPPQVCDLARTRAAPRTKGDRARPRGGSSGPLALALGARAWHGVPRPLRGRGPGAGTPAQTTSPVGALSRPPPAEVSAAAARSGCPPPRARSQGGISPGPLSPADPPAPACARVRRSGSCRPH